MRTKQANVNLFKIKNTLKEFISCYKKILYILFFVALLSILTACLFAIKNSTILIIDNLTNKTLIKFLEGDVSSWGFFFKLFFNGLIVFFIIIVLNIKPWCILFNILTLICFCFLNAFDITVIIIIFSFSGILNALLILIPFFIIQTFLLILLSAISIKYCLIRNKFGKACVNAVCSPYKCYLFFAILYIFFLFLECSLLPIIRITIIVN